MFKALTGDSTFRLAKMADEIDMLYSKFYTRAVRPYHNPPVLHAAPDRPVPTHQKQSLMDVSINDGIHYHGILLLPTRSRLKQDIVAHFNQQAHLYTNRSLLRIDIRPIDSKLSRVVDYIFKAVRNGQFEWTHVLVFPKSCSELS